MAVDLSNPESLLNPLLLSEDESEDAIKSITGTGKTSNRYAATTASILGEQELTFGSVSSGSGLSESETCSEETGDDDYIAELTQQMAEYMFQEDDKQAVPCLAPDKQRKTWGLASSPQSTLWSPFGSSHWGQHGPSPELSPPVMEDHGWDVTTLHHEKQRLVGGVPQTEYPQLRAIQVTRKGNNKKTRQQKRLEIQDSQNKERAKPPPLANPWSSTNLGAGQQQPAGTTAVFIGSRSGYSGTGVFLPRVDHSNTNTSQSRKKLGSSVVIPARVAQALKLHFDHVGLVSKPKSITDSSAALQLDTRNNENKNESENDGLAANHQLEVALPQEWTY